MRTVISTSTVPPAGTVNGTINCASNDDVVRCDFCADDCAFCHDDAASREQFALCQAVDAQRTFGAHLAIPVPLANVGLHHVGMTWSPGAAPPNAWGATLHHVITLGVGVLALIGGWLWPTYGWGRKG